MLSDFSSGNRSDYSSSIANVWKLVSVLEWFSLVPLQMIKRNCISWQQSPMCAKARELAMLLIWKCLIKKNILNANIFFFFYKNTIVWFNYYNKAVMLRLWKWYKWEIRTKDVIFLDPWREEHHSRAFMVMKFPLASDRSFVIQTGTEERV